MLVVIIGSSISLRYKLRGAPQGVRERFGMRTFVLMLVYSGLWIARLLALTNPYPNKARWRVSPRSTIEWETDVSLRPGFELNQSSMRASSSLFTQPALTIVRDVTRFLISA